MATPDFSKIWAANTSLTPYVFDDSDYLEGWEFLGEIPPDRRMFDAWQKQTDIKILWLKNKMLGYLLRQNNTAYQVGDIAFSASLPSNLVLECTTAGTTAASEPDFSGAVIGGTVADGTVIWKYMPLGTLSREITPAFNKRDVITTSGTYTAPVTGWYKITTKGGGGGGGGGKSPASPVESYSGGGGGEGGTTIGFEYITAGDSATVVIGGGGTGGGGTGGAVNATGGNGGASSVTVNGNTYTGGGGGGGGATNQGGTGGTGTIIGAAGGSGSRTSRDTQSGGSGGGNGGGIGADVTHDGTNGTQGGGGGGARGIADAGYAGGDGYVWIEYFAAV